MERTLSSDLILSSSESSAKASWPLRVISTLLMWQRRISSRHQLAMLDSRLLADAGISEAQRELELNKPFWR
ncbi:DUF1127 domain-containing protein [Pseudomonas sp. No.21]|jgi:uncharacterized protein YjiS (DUF1127 family)|uniref:YjiS-like domain-containing protein n=1 Tax=Pseudomonas tohonis TaxID=2725477 RepID=A0A6J4EE61_9PSED|nr:MULTISPECIES: DUF1127 domain-containing protein [Pseudomonas]MBB4822301.1 uncharacterized protein YjiS (DUF1127 family) [Pseudomonas alcaligenes]MDW3716069.1 DUF1127 domain-containing protein [Pseudomonas sp. 2023EL-01195]PZE10962.1 hypothetical protein DMX10_23235 [Pseudomonas sp. 57B-090624]UXY52885.1 DUF1127 domain-containing protein [Pseudomonas tohonis]BBP86236.1 hypothetical protein PHLH8_58780 [Pseudomonas sp. Pc102]